MAVDTLEIEAGWVRLRSDVKDGKINTQAQPLSRLTTISETTPDDDIDDIPVFKLDMLNVELEVNKICDEVGLKDVQYAESNELYAVIDDKEPPSLNFELIGVEKILSAHS